MKISGRHRLRSDPSTRRQRTDTSAGPIPVKPSPTHGPGAYRELNQNVGI